MASIVLYLLALCLLTRYIQLIHSDISGANGFDPIDITSYGRQVLITIHCDQNIILDSDATHKFIFAKDIMIDMFRVPYGRQEML
jgi:hypothetical protein